MSTDETAPIEKISSSHIASERCQGFFHNFNNCISSAVFATDGEMFLQIRQDRWNWSRDRVRIKHYRSGLGIATRDSVLVFVNRERRFSATYTPSVVELFRFGDMSVDAIDDETSNWWLWLSRVVAEPRWHKQLLSLWQVGIEDGPVA